MARNASEEYLEARVMSATPVELVRILYGAAAQSVREARRHLAEGDIAGRSREISKAVAVLVELQSALDKNRGGDLAGRLNALYDYMQRRLLDANIQQSDTPLEEVLGLLTTMEEAWSAASPEPQATAPVAARSMPETVDANEARGYGKFMWSATPACASQVWSA